MKKFALSQPIMGSGPKVAHSQRGFAMSFNTASSLRTTLAERRAARAKRRRTARELASYRSPAERLELDRIVGRHSAEEASEINVILSRQRATKWYGLDA